MLFYVKFAYLWNIFVRNMILIKFEPFFKLKLEELCWIRPVSLFRLPFDSGEKIEQKFGGILLLIGRKLGVSLGYLALEKSGRNALLLIGLTHLFPVGAEGCDWSRVLPG